MFTDNLYYPSSPFPDEVIDLSDSESEEAEQEGYAQFNSIDFKKVNNYL